MSVFYPVSGTVEEPVSLRPDDTAVNDLVEFASTEEVLIIGIIVANEDTSNAQTASVWYTVDSTDFLIFTDDLATASSVHDILPAPIRLRGKDGTRKIRVQAETADKVTFTVIYAGSNTHFANR